MVKYKEYFSKMRDENKKLFAEFLGIHNLYKSDKFKYQTEFNTKGLEVRKIVEDWDRRLCGHMEAGKNAAYSARLSEKFWAEVKTIFPLIDFVGVTIKKAKI